MGQKRRFLPILPYIRIGKRGELGPHQQYALFELRKHGIAKLWEMVAQSKQKRFQKKKKIKTEGATQFGHFYILTVKIKGG